MRLRALRVLLKAGLRARRGKASEGVGACLESRRGGIEGALEGAFEGASRR
jgi:hypothetical protein